jgi:hypothetical protein
MAARPRAFFIRLSEAAQAGEAPAWAGDSGVVFAFDLRLLDQSFARP